MARNRRKVERQYCGVFGNLGCHKRYRVTANLDTAHVKEMELETKHTHTKKKTGFCRYLKINFEKPPTPFIVAYSVSEHKKKKK